MKMTVEGAIAIGLFMLMLGALIVPSWTTAYTSSISWNEYHNVSTNPLGITQATFGAILLAIFAYYIFRG